MKVELFPFQKRASNELRWKLISSLSEFQKTHTPQVISFTAPTGAGKTIIMASLIENVLFGDDVYPDQQQAIFVWLSDSPQLNEQSKNKIESKTDKIRLFQCVTIQEDSFDQEFLDEGHIYFLNTQKLGKSSNLTKKGDSRTYTIWETLANTAKEKNDRMYFIIDEAHRGMHGKEAGRATTIMQKFIKGSIDDGVPAMPVVIGMSATMERFNKLAEGTTSTIRRCVITADEVRSSGLLKDRIIVSHPAEEGHGKEMAVLQAAADDWKIKWDHWSQYCQEQHYAYVNPIFVVQVQSATNNSISDTDLRDCLQKIEERSGFRFKEGEVVHTFGYTSSAIRINGLDVRYEEPSRIADDKKIKIVFFKENLSTGWDCPRAETMMSFRHAEDATYIAQLLGRMIRTPMQMRIQVDDVLNDVHLFLPHFNSSTVKQVVNELQSAEGGEIPAEIHDETIEERIFDTLTVLPDYDQPLQPTTTQEQGEAKEPNQTKTEDPPKDDSEELFPENSTSSSGSSVTSDTGSDSEQQQENNQLANQEDQLPNPSTQKPQNTASDPTKKRSKISPGLFLEREEIVKFINELGLLTYDVRSVKINNYLTSLFKMANVLVTSNLCVSASKDVKSSIAQMIRDYRESLEKDGKYADLVANVKQFKMESQIFDAFGQTISNIVGDDLFTTTDTDIDRRFKIAENKLGNAGVGYEYGRQYQDKKDPNAFKIDVILFVVNQENFEKLNEYAKAKFHVLNDDYRRRIAILESDKIRKQYNDIISDGDIVSKHSFRLPNVIQVPHDNGGKQYDDHLFVDKNTKNATLKLNSWEEGTLEEERKRKDFLCWIRNPARGSWALTIPYEKGGVYKPTYPDLIIVRKDAYSGYVVDILEPHRPDLDDNLGKAKGFAEYARQNPGIGRIQLIREAKDPSGKKRFKRLDMSKSATRDKVLQMINQDELNRLFETDGFFEE